MKHFATLSGAVVLYLLASCAHAPVATSFTQPSTEGIAKAITQVHQDHGLIATAVKTTAKDLDQILDACPQAKAIIVQAQFALTQASDALASAEAATAQAEGARAQLDSQLKQQTDTCNTVARNYATSQAQINALKTSRHGWVSRFWMASGLLVAAGLWIFKRPLMFFMGGIGI